MKKLLIMSALLIGTISQSLAVPVGHVGGIIVDDPRGSYTGIVRSVDPHAGPNGHMYYTYRYYTVTASTMASCQQQLNAMAASPNAYIYQHCYAG